MRMILTATLVYEADPEDYGTSDPREIAALDEDNAIDMLLAQEGDFTISIEPGA